MIGLGSNRLSVCRRGGMSVTQAGRGGMEWLVGNGKRRSSPYSAQATAALKAAFPTQWPTIRDYGFAHPALVPFINEDPMMVCSLGLVVPGDPMPSRYISGDGNAYIALPTVKYSDRMELDCQCSSNDYIAATFFMYNNSSSDRKYYDIGLFGGKYGNQWRWNGSGGIVTIGTNYNGRVIIKNYETAYNYMACYADGVQVGSSCLIGTRITSYGTGTLRLAFRNKGYFALVYNGNTDTIKYNMIPFKHKNGGGIENGMLDLNAVGVEGAQTFYGNSGSGSFTISETPSPQTP